MIYFFAEGSLVDGCLVEFINEHSETWEHVVSKSLKEILVIETITIPNGRYHTVRVYDIVSGRTSERISINYTIELNVNISIIHTATSSYLGMFLAGMCCIIKILSTLNSLHIRFRYDIHTVCNY